MTNTGYLHITLFAIILFLCTKPLGIYMKKVLECEATFLSPLLNPVERLTYKLFGVNENHDMPWTEYALAMLAFSSVSLLFSYAILRLQGFLPLNPMGFSTAMAPAYATSMTADLAFNTAVSFATNTNWQSYSGEATLSYLSQMLALAFHNWVSAAAGIAVAIAMVRGFSRRSAKGLGNFWQDLTRSTLYILLPMCTVFSLFLVWQGCVQNFNPYVEARTLEGLAAVKHGAPRADSKMPEGATPLAQISAQRSPGVHAAVTDLHEHASVQRQIIAQGPVASQESIKLLGTNGGGFFGANSAHPYENPTPLANFVEMLSIFLIPAGLTYTFGLMVGNTKHGWALFITMMVLFLVGTLVCYGCEAQGNPNLPTLGVDISTSALQDAGGNMEGKEVRFGLASSSLFAVITTGASCGAVNSMHDSFMPLSGMILLINMKLGEVIFGGVGAGLYGMLIFAVLTVFIAGLMVGRTPEYVGKKIEKKEVKMCMLFVLAAAFSILCFTAVASVLNLPQHGFWNPGAPAANIANGGPHGLSEMLYAYTSGTANNGSAFAGLSTNTPYYNLTLALAMLIGRFLLQVPVLALAGSLAQKKATPPTAGTFPTDGFLFVTLLLGVILIVGALTFFPALTLGPLVEHFLMLAGRLF